MQEGEEVKGGGKTESAEGHKLEHSFCLSPREIPKALRHILNHRHNVQRRQKDINIRKKP